MPESTHGLWVAREPERNAPTIAELAHQLADLQIEVVGDAESLEHAFRRGAFDFVILDSGLAWTTGSEVLQRIKVFNPLIPVIMMAGSESGNEVLDAVSQGLDDYVVNVTAPEVALSLAIRSAARRSRLRRKSTEVETKLNQLLNRLSVGVFRTTLQGELLEANAAMLGILGVRSLPQDPPLNLFDRFVDARERERLSDLLQATRTVLDHQVQLRRLDDSVVWVNLTETLGVDASNVIVVDGLVEDVTERRMMRRALSESEERYRRLVELSPEAVVVHSGAGIEYINPAGARLLGVDEPDALIGQDLLSYVHETSREFVRDRIRHALGSRVQVDLMELTVSSADGRNIVVEAAAIPITFEGKPAVQIAARDITERKRAEHNLIHNAFHDPLTRLPNRALFLDRLRQTVAVSARQEGYLFAVLFLDLDRFKLINDSLGHLAGDQLLTAVARRLEGCVRPGDTVARFAGDEFTILLNDLHHEGDATRISERIQRELNTPFRISGHDVYAGVSIGIASGSHDQAQDAEGLLRNADAALYRAKSLGRGRYEIFNADTQRTSVARLQLEADLTRAIERDELRLHYQPIIALATGAIVGLEALVRWERPQHGLLMPSEFLPVAEETGQIVSIDWWVLKHAVQQLKEWSAERRINGSLRVSVNLSPRQFAHPNLVDRLRKMLQETGIDASRLRIEMTEGALLDNPELIANILQQLRDLGVEVQIDDFGTGYSSLSYLNMFPIHALKIDRLFIRRMNEGRKGNDIVRSVVTLAHSLDMAVIAEGVEDNEQQAVLRGFGCDYAQGFLFSRPLDSAAAGKLLEEKRVW